MLGEPDVDYPIFNTPPDTGFECGDKADGMYADVDARCQVCWNFNSDGWNLNGSLWYFYFTPHASNFIFNVLL